MASSIHPLAALYDSLNLAFSDEDEEKLRNLLRDHQIPVRDLQKLHNPAQIFNYLERQGRIDKDNLQLLKDLLTKIRRLPLIKLVNDCEKILKTHSEMPKSKRPHLSGGHYAGPSGRGAVDRKDRNRMHDKIPDVVNLCQKSLQEKYNNYSHITPFPWWDGTERLKLEDVYTELELQTKDRKKTNIAKADMFSPRDDCVTPRRILIEGDPGYGKSTFCKKMALDWASKESGYLNRFKLLFFLELRDVFEYHRNNPDKQCLIDVISDLYLDYCDQDKSDLWNYIQGNQSEICFIFDGLDEVPAKDLPCYFKEIVQQKFTKLKNGVVVVTSRKIRDKDEKQFYDTQLCIKGFDDKTFKEFVTKHFKATHKDEVHGGQFVTKHFLRKLDDLTDEHVLGDFSKSPLMALMLCDIAIENETLPETVTKLYTCIVDVVIKRYLSEGNVSEEKKSEVTEDIILTLSRIAYRPRYIFGIKDEDIASHEHVLKVGFLTKASKPLSSRHPIYTFVHKTFEEYFVAKWLSASCDGFVIKLREQLDDYYISFTSLKFLAGIYGNNVTELFKEISLTHKFRGACFERAETVEERGSYYDEKLSNMMLNLLIESCLDSTESIEACAAAMPGTVKLNLDNISEYNRGTKVVKEVIRCCIDRPDSDDTLVFQIEEKNVKTSEMFKRLSKSLAADDSKVKQALFVNYTCFESQFDWLSSNLHHIRELQVFDIPLEFSDIVSQVRTLHTQKLLEVVVLRSKHDYTNTFKVFVRKGDTGSIDESSDGIHVSFNSDLTGKQRCTQMAASLKSMKAITFDDIELKVRLEDVTNLQTEVSNISECVQSVNTKLMSIRIGTSFDQEIYDYLKFNITSSLKPLHPSKRESLMDRKLQISMKKYYKFEVRLREVKDLLPCIEHIALERLDLICVDDNDDNDDNDDDDDDDDDERVNVKRKTFIDALYSLTRFKARQVFLSFPLFRFDLMETVNKAIQRKDDSPSIEVTFFEKLGKGHVNCSVIKSQINVQVGKDIFQFTSNRDTFDVESLNRSVSGLVTSSNERVTIEILHKVNSLECDLNCSLMGLTLSMPSLDGHLIKKVVRLHDLLTYDVRKNLNGDEMKDEFAIRFSFFYIYSIFARNFCRKSRQRETVNLIEQELASDTSFVQGIKLSRREMCVTGKSQKPTITQTNEIEDRLMLSCQFNDRDVPSSMGNFVWPDSIEDYIEQFASEKIRYPPLDELFSDLCRTCENNPQTQYLCLTFSEKDSAEKSLTEQIVNIVHRLRYLCKLDIVNGDFTSGTDDDELWIQLLKNGSLTDIAFHKCNLNDKIDTLTGAIREVDEHRQGKLKVSLCDSLEIESTTKFRDKLCESHFKISTIDNICLEGANISVNIENANIQCSHEI